MHPAGAAVYHPASATSRATAITFILGAHVLVILAILSVRGVVVERVTPTMQVALVPEPPRHAAPVPAHTVPLPQMRKPEVVIQEPPRFEVLRTVEAVERPVPPPPAKAVVAPMPTPTPEAAPAPEPPRFDLAYLDNPAPVYPVFARRAREQGTVMLRVAVDAEGHVTGIQLQRSSGSDRLDDAALHAVKRWRFAPARLAGRAVAGVALVPINFQLEG